MVNKISITYTMIENFLIVFLVILLLQVVFFVYAVINKTDKVTDLSYGLTFIIASVASLILGYESISIFKWLLFALVSVWGIRLSTYLFIRILRTGKDKRFDGIREDPLKFASFWVLQALSIFIILLPTTYILLLPVKMGMNVISYVGFLIAIFGLLIESIADMQKFVFKSKEENKGRWIQSGLWKYSRHPNYLGEILMWLGVFVFSLMYLNDWGIFTFLSPLYITILLLFVSGIPKLEKEYENRYKGNLEYERYVKNTGVLLPKIFVKKN